MARAPAVVERQQSADSFYPAVAKILVLVRRLWASLVFDELPPIAQPLDLGALGVALIIFGGSPARCARS
jgi:hypothetical protein